MSHNLLTLHGERFDTRVRLGGCLININGETKDCTVERDGTNMTSPTYTVVDKDTGAELCTFRSYHLHGGPFWYQIEGASESGGEATLIVPDHGLFDEPEDEEV